MAHNRLDRTVWVKTLDHCNVVFEKTVANGMNVVRLPRELLIHFDRGYGAVRIYSAQLANVMPDFGGGTATGSSQIPHQDHAPNDVRRFLAFSKPDQGPRGSETYLMHPVVVREILPSILQLFECNRTKLRDTFVHRPPYMISDSELMRCFAKGGFEEIAQSKLGDDPTSAMRLFVYMGLLTYVIQGDLGDELVETLLQTHAREIVREPWERPGTLIVDNSRIFHGRYGPNVRLKRNWVVAP